MNKLKALFVISLTAIALAVPPSGINAQSCTTQYGNGQYGTTCVPIDVTINKQVKNPISRIFVENLGPSDDKFSPGAEVHFKLIVHNASSQDWSRVTVHDTLPQFLTFEAGPGTYDSNSKLLTIELENLKVNETRELEFLAKVVSSNAFPTDKSLFCVVNVAEVKVDSRTDEDTAQLCIQTQVLGVTTLPVAGFDAFALLVPFAGLGLTGLALLKKRV